MWLNLLRKQKCFDLGLKINDKRSNENYDNCKNSSKAPSPDYIPLVLLKKLAGLFDVFERILFSRLLETLVVENVHVGMAVCWHPDYVVGSINSHKRLHRTADIRNNIISILWQNYSQLTVTCSKSEIKTLEKDVKHV